MTNSVGGAPAWLRRIREGKCAELAYVGPAVGSRVVPTSISTALPSARAVEYRPGPKIVSTLDGVLYAVLADGWSMWPNLWHGDLALCEPIRLKLDENTTRKEWSRWRELQNRIVAIQEDGRRPRLKRVIQPCSGPIGKFILWSDNVSMFEPDHIDCHRRLFAFGVVKAVHAGLRNNLPDELRAEWERLKAQRAGQPGWE